MQQASSPVLQQLRSLHPGALQTLHQSPDGTLYPQTVPELQNLHSSDVFHHHQQYALNGPPPPQPPAHAIHFEQHGLPTSAQFPPFPSSYQHAASPRFALTNPLPASGSAQQQFHASQPLPPPRPTQQLPLPLPPQPIQQHVEQVQSSQVQGQAQVHEGDDVPSTGHGQFQGLKLIADPPDLEEWREKLFNVDDTITLTEEEFQTYFPHIDNVYSHRSTQRHKRKRFVSHYWDCRLKGRPPGTKKSTDPDKKKRKRVARERDLCDVKIKVTEYFDAREYEEQMGQRPPGVQDDPTSPETTTAPGSTLAQVQQFYGQSQILEQQPIQAWNMPPPNLAQPGMNMNQFAPSAPPPPGSPPKKFYTFQRVNGNGGNGKGDGVAGPHKHTLEESDRVKKNSVLRWLAKCKKDDRKKSQGGDPSKKTYHKKATGNALTTVKNHSKDDDLKLYGSCFCPFVQRVWISLEHKQIPYQYIEVDPYKKPQSLLDVNPRGLVPALRHGPTWSTHESTVIMEYLEDLNTGPPLLPPDARTRATSRLWSDHVNRNVIPWFYKLLQAQDQNDQIEHAKELRDQISKLVDAADPTGPFFLGSQISFVDVQIAPWMIRLRRVLAPYRGWPEAEEGSRWKKWVDAIEGDRSVRMTTSTDELYVESYERYAENRPGTR
ncbi:Nn.00g020100.m01.CDS01 [Neocucurbitaria sp. VM-36]